MTQQSVNTMSRSLRKYAPIIIVMVMGVLLSIFAFQYTADVEAKRIVNEFELAAKEREQLLRQQIDFDLNALEAVGGLYAASKSVERDEFHAFSEKLITEGGVTSLAWLPRIVGAKKAAFEKQVQQEGLPQYRIVEFNEANELVPVPDRLEYFPIYFFESPQTDHATWGLDLAANPANQRAIETARSTGELALTSRTQAVEETVADDDFEASAFYPIYTNGSPQDTLQDRRQNLMGYVVANVRFDDIFDNIVDKTAPIGMDMYLFDLSAPAGKQFLSYHRSRFAVGEPPSFETLAALTIDEVKQGVYSYYILEMGQRQWAVVLVPAASFMAERQTWHSWAVLGVGLFFTLLLAQYLFTSMKRNAMLTHEVRERQQAQQALEQYQQNLEQIVAERTTQLEAQTRAHQELLTRQQAILDTVPVGIVVVKERKFIWSNTRFAEILGVDLEAVGALSTRDLYFNANDFETFGRDIYPRIAQGETCTVEVQMKNWQTNNPIWCNFKGRALNVNDLTEGTIWSLEDISVRKEARQQIQQANEELAASNEELQATSEQLFALTENLRLQIAKQQETEAILQQRTNEQNALLSTIPAIVFFKDRKSNYIAINQTFATMLNLDTPDLVKGKTDYDFFPPEQAEAFRADDEWVMASGQAKLNIEEPVMGADGKNTWSSTSKAPVFDAHGNVIGIVGMGMDITARKEAELALKQANVNMQAILESTQDSIIAIDTEYRYIAFNSVAKRAALHTFGVEMYLGMSELELMQNEVDRTKAKTALDRALAGERFTVEEMYGNDEQHRSWFEMSYNPILSDGKVVGVTLLIRNITDRKQAEAEIKRANLNLQAILESTNDTIAAIDRNYRYIAFNSASKLSSKYAFGVDINLDMSPLDMMYNEADYARTKEALDRVLAGEQFTSEAIYGNDEESRTWYETSYNPIFNESEVVGATVFVRNITERKRAEWHLQQINEELATSNEELRVTEEQLLSLTQDLRLQIAQKEQAEAAMQLANLNMRAILESTQDSIFALDRHYCYTAFNSAGALDFKTTFGVDLYAGLNPLEIIQDEAARAHTKAAFDRALMGESFTVEQIYGNEGQTQTWFELAYNPIRNEEDIAGMTVFVRNITDRKRAEAEIKQANLKMQALLDSSPIGIVAVKDRKFIWSNHRFAEIMGVNLEEVGALSTRDIYANPEEFERFGQEAYPLIAQGKIYAGELLLKNKSTNQPIWCSMSGQAIDVNDLSLGSIWSLEDISTRRESRQQLLALTEDLRLQIAQKEQAEAAMRFANLNMQAILESTKDRIVAMDTEGRYIAFNSAAKIATKEIFGVEIQLGMRERDLMQNDDDRAKTQAAFDRVLAGEQFVVEGIYGKDDQTRTWAEISYNPIFDGSVVAGATLFVRDITERKRAEVELRESQEKFQVILENAPEAILLVDKQGKILLTNNRTEDIFGYTREELMGQPIEILVPMGTRSGHAKLVANYFDNPYTRQMGHGFQLHGQRKDGVVFPIDAGLSSIQTKDGMLATVFVTDISQRRAMEEAMRRSEALLKSIMNNTPTIIYVKAADDGRYLLVNRAFEELVNLTSEQILGKNDYDLFPKETAEAMRENDLKVIQSNALSEREEVVPSPDGAIQAYMSLKFPLHDEQGQIYAMCGMSTNITERKRNEDALRLSERRQRALLDVMPDLMFQINHDGIFLDYRATRDETVVPLDMIIGHSIQQIMPAPFATLVMGYIHQTLTQNSMQTFEYQLPVARGLQEYEARMVPAGEAEVLTIVRNVTDRKEAERRLASLYRISQGLNAAITAQDILNVLIQPVTHQALATVLFYIELDASGAPDLVEIAATYTKGEIMAAPVGTQFKLSEFAFSKVWLNNPHAPTLIANSHTDPTLDEPLRDMFLQLNILSTVNVPLNLNGRWLGLLAYSWPEPQTFSDNDLEIYHAIMHLATAAVQNHRIVRDLQKEVVKRNEAEQRIKTLYHMSQGLNIAADEQALVDVLVEVFKGKGFVATLMRFELDAQHQPLWAVIVAAHGSEDYPHSPIGTRYYLPEFPFSNMWLNNPDDPVFIEDSRTSEVLDENTRALFIRLNLLRMVTVPIRLNHRWVGVLTYQWREARPFSAEEIEICRTIMSIAAPAVDSRRLIRDLQMEIVKRNEAEQQIKTLYHMSQGLNFAANEQAVLEVLIEMFKGEGFASTLFHFELDEQAQPLWAVLVANYAAEGQPVAPIGTRYYLPEFPSSKIWFVNPHAPFLVDNVQTTDLLDENIRALFITRKIGRVVTIPILLNNRWVGLLTYQWRDARPFGSQEIEIYRTIMSMAAPAVDSRRLIRDLQTEIVKRNEAEIQMRHAKEQAEAANRAKSDFLASMSHELRTPLNGILGYAQILGRDKNLSTQQLNGVNIIQQSGEHLLTLINDILDLSKIEAGRIEIHPTEFNLMQFMQNIINVIRLRAEQTGLTFTYKPMSDLPLAVLGDEKRLRQVLINLLGNAVKFTKQGGVTLKVGPHYGKIRFQIEDTGIGIPEDQLELIFQPFRQVGDVYMKAEGTGLGLSISKRLVEALGGELKVMSNLGVGSTFWFDVELPQADHWQGVNTTPKPLVVGYRHPEGRPLKILVVDDKATNRSLAIDLLKPLGFDMYEAVDGQHGLEQAKLIQPDVVLMDIVMPIMNGLEATRQIRQDPHLNPSHFSQPTELSHDIIIIAASASAFENDYEASLAAGCDDFIPKPLHLDGLLQKLEKMLGLQWLYETDKQAEVKTTSPESQTEQVGPPIDIAQKLLQFAQMGRIKPLRETIDQLETMGLQYQTFIEKMRQLIKQYKMKEIEILLQSYL